MTHLQCAHGLEQRKHLIFDELTGTEFYRKKRKSDQKQPLDRKSLLEAASVNLAVMSRGTADCATTRGGGTRTSLFGSIAQRIEALQSAARAYHRTENCKKEDYVDEVK